MKKNIFNKLVLSFVEVSALTLALTSCEPEAVDTLSGETTTEGAGSQVTVSSCALAPGLSLTAGNYVGVAVGYNDSKGMNQKYEIQNDGTAVPVSGTPVYIKNSGNLLFYYPFTGSEGANPWIEFNTEDQNALNPSPFYMGYSNAASGAAMTDIAVTLDDFYGLVQFNLTNIPAGEVIDKVYVNSLVMKSTFDMINRTLEDEKAAVVDLYSNYYQANTLKLIPHDYAASDNKTIQVICQSGQQYNIKLGAFSVISGKTTTLNVDVASEVTSVAYSVPDVPWNPAN